MTQEERYRIISNDYADLFIEYNRNEKLLNRFPNAVTNAITDRYAVVYTPADILTRDFINKYGYAPLPRCYGITSIASLEASGVQQLRSLPNYNLRGQGVLVAIIDTGIDYSNPIFIKEDGTSKIIALWDQTVESEKQYPADFFYGTEYSREQINSALKGENPLSIVPSVDEVGHGTMLAGIIAGSEVSGSNFSGVVPEADMIIVKLKPAKQNLKDFFIIPADVPCYQENDIVFAIKYITDMAAKLKRPCALCIGLGSSQGSHDVREPLDYITSYISNFLGFAVVVAAGNEGNKKRHFFSTISPSAEIGTVELNIGVNEKGFSMELWGKEPNTYSIDILTPSGEYIPRIAESLRTNQEIRFIFETTTISVNYRLIEMHTGVQLILLRFRNPSPGIWKFQVYSRGDLPGSFHIWLPGDGFITEDTYFIKPDSYTTITSPGNAVTSITATAYNPDNDTLYDQASRGYSRTGVINPILAAPGVNMVVPTLSKGFTTASGTSLAAAYTAGISAIMLEWGIVRGFYPIMDTTVIKKYLIRGARRSKSLQYPNRDWGYGIIDLYNVFNVLRTDFPSH